MIENAKVLTDKVINCLLYSIHGYSGEESSEIGEIFVANEEVILRVSDKIEKNDIKTREIIKKAVEEATPQIKNDIVRQSLLNPNIDIQKITEIIEAGLNLSSNNEEIKFIKMIANELGIDISDMI